MFLEEITNTIIAMAEKLIAKEAMNLMTRILCMKLSRGANDANVLYAEG
jgi:hypothetical protein